MAGRRAWRILGVVALLRGCGCLVSTRRVVTRGVALFAGIPDWDSIKPEAEAKAKRMKDVRAKMNELREMKQQGRRYDGKRLDDVEVVAEAKNKRMAEAGFSQLMDEGEALFGGGAGEARKQAAALKQELKALEIQEKKALKELEIAKAERASIAAEVEAEEAFNGPTMHLSYHGKNHYNSMRLTTDQGAPPRPFDLPADVTASTAC